MNNIQIVEISVIAVSLIFSLISFYYTIKTKKRYERVIMRLGAGEDLRKIMDKYITQVQQVEKKNNQIADYCTNLDRELSKSIKKIGLIKYDAFNDTKNKLSFSLALLDRNNSGIIINSIYGINNSNVYAKPIIKGSSKYNLSSEEIDALKKAMEK